MNALEMREVEDLLRDLIRSAGLDWLLDELDEAIATGVAEEKLLQRRRGTSTEEYEALAVADMRTDTFHRSVKRGASVVVTTRPMNARERTELHLDALRRLFLELPEIEAETLKIVNAGDDPHAHRCTACGSSPTRSSPGAATSPMQSPPAFPMAPAHTFRICSAQLVRRSADECRQHPAP